MRYSQFFTRAVELSQIAPDETRKLLRQAERHASEFIPEHLVLCSKVYLYSLNDPDNAMRCLLESECRTEDTRGLLELAEAYWNLFQDVRRTGRCLQKAIKTTNSTEDEERLQELLAKVPPSVVRLAVLRDTIADSPGNTPQDAK